MGADLVDHEGQRPPKTGLCHIIGVESLRERMERVLRSDKHYGVRFDNSSATGEFAYSWAAIWSEN
jgi:hypothetical protein